MNNAELAEEISRQRTRLLFVTRKCGIPKHSEDDVIQAVYLRASGRLFQLQDESRIAGWLATITCRISFDWHRSQRRDTRQLDFDPLWFLTDNSPEAEAIAKETRDSVRKCVESNRYSVLIKQLFFDGMTVTEIADHEGISRQSINKKKLLAFEMLKHCLRGKLESDESDGGDHE